ncbi:hypothetical protein [Xylocopilactobacillus apicola]|uniref:Uncharacterized protein n=1 Tax=Xylocopilactobacillus apicola TaxID=2932184 RepID=A0AAU9DSF3_9LACO|nr:hypothetical protein [Xylocopilactobacillus apicola]BDR58193.1 hypothetical protein XA3_06340 [Xylocopilactobacillus apicola]
MSWTFLFLGISFVGFAACLGAGVAIGLFIARSNDSKKPNSLKED